MQPCQQLLPVGRRATVILIRSYSINLFLLSLKLELGGRKYILQCLFEGIRPDTEIGIREHLSFYICRSELQTDTKPLLYLLQYIDKRPYEPILIRRNRIGRILLPPRKRRKQYRKNTDDNPSLHLTLSHISLNNLFSFYLL